MTDTYQHPDPAPWSYEYLPYQTGDGTEIPAFRINDENGDPVCETNEHVPLKTQEATARLIAAAPELLAVCKMAWQLAYTLGDKDSQESRDLFALHMACDAVLQKALPDS